MKVMKHLIIRKMFFVYVNNTTDITYLLTYDDSDVDLLKAGSYEVILSVEYLEKIYETTLTITGLMNVNGLLHHPTTKYLY